MKHNRRSYTLAAAVALAASGHVQAQLRIVSYNVAADVDGVTTVRPGFDSVMQGIGNETVNSFARPLDILALQEVTSNNTTVAPIVTSLNNTYGANTYAMSTFVGSTSGGFVDNGNGPNAMVYNTKTVTLISAVGFGTVNGSNLPRQEIRYQFRPVGYGPSADFYVYVGHFKASADGTETVPNSTRRNIEAQAIRANAAALPAGSRLLYTGDYNMVNGSQEPAWQTLVAPPSSGSDPGQAIDPINLGNGSWNNNNTTFRGAYSHSSTSLNRRYDFQLNTAATMDDKGFSLIDGSYRVFGNNGSTPRSSAANSASNTALSGLPNRSTVLDAITTASDHYAVVGDYRLPAKAGLAVSAPSQVIVGASVPVSATVTNAAPVQVAIGADTLDYTLTSSGSLSGSGNATNVAALATGNLHSLTLNTSTVGSKSGTISINSTSQEAGSASFSQTINTTVLAHAHPSFASPAQADSLTISFGTRAQNSAAEGLGTPSASFSVNNLSDVSGFSSKLDLDSIVGSGSTSALTTTLSPFANLAAAGSQSFLASLSTTSFGLFSATYTLNLSDENIPGATSTAPLTLTLIGRIAMAGDSNIDGVVNALDFNALASSFGQTGQMWDDGDFNGDGSIATADFTALSSHFGSTYNPNPAPALGQLVPEPSALAALALLATLSRRQRVNFVK